MVNYTPIDVKRIQEKFYAVSAGGKEGFAPFDSKQEVSVDSSSVEQELNIENRVEVRQEEIKVDDSLTKFGLKPVKVEFEDNQSNNLNFGVSDDKIWQGLHAPVNSSLRWFSEFVVYILKKFNIKLKKVNGKVVRVLSD